MPRRPVAQPEKRLLPLALMFAAVSSTASAQHFACTTIQPGDTAARVALQLTGKAENRHQVWFQIFDPVTARFVSKDAYDTILQRHIWTSDGESSTACRALPSLSFASSRARCPGEICLIGPSPPLFVARRTGGDWTSCSRPRRATAIPTCRTTGRICRTTSNVCFDSSRINRFCAVNRNSVATGWSSRFGPPRPRRWRRVSSEGSSFECRWGRREYSALRKGDVSPRSGNNAQE